MYAFITLALCTAYYLMDYGHATNPVDRLCIERLTKCLTRLKSDHPPKWGPILRNAVLTFSDLQVVSSLSLLITGYSQFGCGFDSYHWQITIDLAWFSSMTHLTTLTCLRRHFQERLALRLSRMICMIIVAAMLSLTLFSTGWTMGVFVPYALPAQCLYHSSIMKAVVTSIDEDNETIGGLFNSVYVAASLIFIGLSYVTRMILLFPSASEALRAAIRTRPSRIAKRFLGRLSHQRSRSSEHWSKVLWNMVYISTLSVYCIMKAGADLYTSTLWEVRY